MQLVPSASGTTDYTLAPLPKPLLRSLTEAELAELRKSTRLTFDLPKDKCLTCRKQGPFKTRLHDRSVVTCECNCREQWMLGRLLLAAGIGDTYQRYSWHHVRTVPDTIVDMIKHYLGKLDDFFDAGVGMILWSERTGTGKSLLAYLILKEALAQGYTARMTTLTEMLDHYTASWSDKAHRDWFLREIQNVDFLAIDEFGKENPNRGTVVDELVDRVIRARVAHGRPTILPTNLNPSLGMNVGKDFSRYQAGLLDLLTERSLMIEVVGLGYREQQQRDLMTDVREGIRYPVVVR